MRKQLRICLLCLLTLCCGMTAAAATYHYEFGSKENYFPFADKPPDTENLNGLNWTLHTDGPRASHPNVGGIQYGKSTEEISYLSISTSDIRGIITSVKVEAMCAKDASGLLEVKVGDVGFECGGKTEINLSNDYITYDFQGAETGQLLIHLFYKEKKKAALYLHNVTITYNDGTVTTIEIDELKDNQTVISGGLDQSNQTVKLKRTLSADYWNTFCVPFDISADAVTNLFGGAEIREFSGKVENEIMIFRKAEMIEAGIPYIIKPAKTIANPTFTGVTLTADSPHSVEDGTGQYAFIGTFSPCVLKTDGTEQFLGDNDYLYKPQENKSTINGLRAWFRLPAKNTPSRIKMMDESALTGIRHPSLELEPGAEPVYTIDGRYVGRSVQGLPQGIYVVHGKKTILK